MCLRGAAFPQETSKNKKIKRKESKHTTKTIKPHGKRTREKERNRKGLQNSQQAINRMAISP